MPIEILGRKYLTEAEFAQQLGCTPITLQRLRAKKAIGYQRLPGKRGAFYGEQHVQECLTALSMPARVVAPSFPMQSGEERPIPAAPPKPKYSAQIELSDIQRASEILGRRKRV